jgi:hypothetical protein
MSSLDELHESAMTSYEESCAARRSGDEEGAITKLRHALSLEMRAAEMLGDKRDHEPSRSVLFRSSASLALQMNDPKLAQKLVLKALDGFPPREIADELGEIMDEAIAIATNRENHLRIISNTKDEPGAAVAIVALPRAIFRSHKRLAALVTKSNFTRGVVVRRLSPEEIMIRYAPLNVRRFGERGAKFVVRNTSLNAGDIVRLVLPATNSETIIAHAGRRPTVRSNSKIKPKAQKTHDKT